MDLHQAIRELLLNLDDGRTTNTAYDTAWIARLGEIGDPIGEPALAWLREHQLPDGSWGANEPYYSHDRVVCTLAAMNALARRGRVQDRALLRRAEEALDTAIQSLDHDPAGETVGFELIVPTLLYEAKALGALHREESTVLAHLMPYRAAKLAALPDGMVNRHVTAAHSAEMAGSDGQKILDADNLQEANGSVGLSPAATAYFALYVRRRDPQALGYLHQVASEGPAPDAIPLDIFERAWVLWNLALTGTLHNELLDLCQPHLDFLEGAWVPERGVGFAMDYTPKDSDDTSLTYEVLTRFGRTVDLDAVLSYEHVYYFRCFELESNPSISANIHVLGALRQAGIEKEHPAVQKVLKFLSGTKIEDISWHDKWHTSPYYATVQAVIACGGYANELVERSIPWILENQNADGSWGYYLPTAEETAYCLQALAFWQRHSGEPSVPKEALKRGRDWLLQHVDPPYPPLWIDKCLYCPNLIVRSAVLSALTLTS
jgi:halimadienyl-diphosphate synthase